MKKHIFLSILSYFLLLIFLNTSCKKKDKNCPTSGVTADIQISKISESCADINLPWEITFGVELQYLIDIKCEGNCSNQRVTYLNSPSILKKTDGTIWPIGAPHGGLCNKMNTAGTILNTKKENDNNLFTFEIGDTIAIEFRDPILCTSDGFSGCDSEEVPLDIQEFYFEYILAPEDFCN